MPLKISNILLAPHRLCHVHPSFPLTWRRSLEPMRGPAVSAWGHWTTVLRPNAMLAALELVVGHVVLDRCGCQGSGRSRRGGSSPVTSSSIAQWMAAIWSGETVG